MATATNREAKPLLQETAPTSYGNNGFRSGPLEVDDGLVSPQSPHATSRSNSLSQFKRLTSDDRTSSCTSLASFVSLGHGVITVPEKTIGFIGSLSLISNNTTGPAMMGLPFLVLKAGIIPVLGSIIICAVLTSLAVTMMADAISAIPRNKNFDRPITFSTAFRIIAGKRWAAVVELLFMMSCMVQACAALVETAQSLDGFIASFLLGRSYALQVSPTLQLLSWEASKCDISGDDASGCVPFADGGSLVLTLGFIVATCIFLPFGLGHLKETIIVQILSFACLFVLLSSFYYEFFSRGFPNWSNLRWFGDDYSQLAGVVLFNYAFSITVPSWLNEKKKDVSVNKVVWFASAVSTGMYLTFSVMGAASFSNISDNALQILASAKVHSFTRICAAVFGVAIIASGVPIFSIMMHDSLYYSGICSGNMALFVGGFLPYLISWMLYQGQFLMNALNWAGLVVNGFVAFIFPLFLTIFALRWIDKSVNGNSSSGRGRDSELGIGPGKERSTIKYSNSSKGSNNGGYQEEQVQHGQEDEESDEDDVSLDSVELEMIANQDHHSEQDDDDYADHGHGHDHSHEHSHEHGHTNHHPHHYEQPHVIDRQVIGITGYVAKLFEPQKPKEVTLFQRDTVRPLACASGALVPYRELIVQAIAFLFVSVVVSNIAIDWYKGVQP